METKEDKLKLLALCYEKIPSLLEKIIIALEVPRVLLGFKKWANRHNCSCNEDMKSLSSSTLY